MGFEYGNEIIIIDMGLQFPDQYQHGVSSSIPDLTYVHGKKIVAVLITHGHIDHIGAIPFLMRQIGKNVPLYATPMAYELIKMKQSEIDYQLTNIQEYHRNKSVVLSENFTVTPFTVDHSIPDSVGLCIDTPVGRFIHTGDWKFDKTPLPHRPSTDYALLENFGDRGVRALLSDSTNAHLSGSSISESEVVGSIDDIFAGAKARVITATFSSIIDRIILIIATSEKFGRKVVLLGRGMNNYMDIALKLGYARPQPGTLITMAEADKLPDDQVTICCTGAQGERYAALMRIATGESYDTTLRPTDTVVFSSSVIPGNERSVQGLFDIIMAQGPRICQYKESRIHAGGHAQEEDTKKMISLIRPEVYVPIYGFPFMLHGNAKNAYDLGYDENHVLIGKNGQIFEFTKDSFKLTNMYAPHRLVTVDGNMIGYSKEDTLHDRFQLSTGGAMVVSIAKKAGEYLYQFDNVGIPNMSEFPHLEKRLIQVLDTILQGDISKFRDIEALKKFIAKKIGDTVFDELAKEPLVMVLAH
jgi:ribonuclease J